MFHSEEMNLIHQQQFEEILEGFVFHSELLLTDRLQTNPLDVHKSSECSLKFRMFASDKNVQELSF